MRPDQICYEGSCYGTNQNLQTKRKLIYVLFLNHGLLLEIMRYRPQHWYLGWQISCFQAMMLDGIRLRAKNLDHNASPRIYRYGKYAQGSFLWQHKPVNMHGTSSVVATVSISISKKTKCRKRNHLPISGKLLTYGHQLARWKKWTLSPNKNSTGTLWPGRPVICIK